jgi:hypothetical protein
MKTYHVESPDLSTSRSRTCPWDLAHGVPSASLLKGLTLGWDVDGMQDPAMRVTVWAIMEGTPTP